jgi:hypothetical protein
MFIKNDSAPWSYITVDSKFSEGLIRVILKNSVELRSTLCSTRLQLNGRETEVSVRQMT